MKEINNKIQIEKDIKEAYENQTQAVKVLLESAKNNLKQDKKAVVLKTTKGKAEQIYVAGEFINRGNREKNKLENLLKEEFEKTNKNIQIHSKNLDFIIQTVTEREVQEGKLLNKVVEQSEEYHSKIEEEFTSIKEQTEVNQKKIQNKLQKIKEKTSISNITIQEMLKEIKKKNEISEENLESILAKMKEQNSLESKQTIDIIKNIKEHNILENAKMQKVLADVKENEIANAIQMQEKIQDNFQIQKDYIKEVKDQLANCMQEVKEEGKVSTESITELAKEQNKGIVSSLDVIQEENKIHNQYIIEIKDELVDYLQNIKVENNEGIDKILKRQEAVLDSTNQIKEQIEEKNEEIKKIYEESLASLKSEIIAEYAKATNYEIKEKEYLWKQITEKEEEIRNLREKVYEYQIKLEKEKNKRKFALWNRQKQEPEDQETRYACQILNSIMNY